jgi:hypothetical protein
MKLASLFAGLVLAKGEKEFWNDEGQVSLNII